MGITLEGLDRPSIRALAEKHSAELRDVAQSGGNVYQASLDQQDKINEFTSTLSEEDAIKFLNTYSEELNACASKANDEAAVVLAEAESSNGFTPDFTDTYKKADTGHEECSCQSVASSVPSSSVVQWNKQVGQVSAAPR